MRTLLTVAAVAAAALSVAACDMRSGAQSAYLNSGASATPAMPATSLPSQPATEPSTEPMGASQPALASLDQNPTTTAPATSDTASPNTAPPEPASTPPAKTSEPAPEPAK